MSINGGEDHFLKLGSIQNTCQRYLTRFDPMTSFFTPHSKGYLDNVELNSLNSFSRLNTRFTSPQTCHMLPLDQVKHRSNSGPYKYQIHLIFMNEPIKYERCLDALNMSLVRIYAMPINFYLGLLEGEACHLLHHLEQCYLSHNHFDKLGQHLGFHQLTKTKLELSHSCLIARHWHL